ncbi:Rieske (2Fe-2S) protein [Streptomyces sp. SID3343]|uniref:Rieske 2Fe-2S domain-containing protein n=1 Tax=Streptomyces sp. SID3343 TaxID=2690260 RepID=UPI001F33281E|nr:Rieske (2Fe-2S) protein [Streptomyces sp. SID3343]
MRLTTAITTGLEQATALDRPAARLRGLVERVPQGRTRDALHGVPIGHPLHPMLVQVPIGTWISASLLDVVPRTGIASGVLIAVGLGAAVPAAAAGALDWAQTHEQQQRVGLVHATCNIVGVGLYSASLIARLRRRPLRGRALALAGLATVSAGGLLGGHLAYRQAVGANHTEDVAHVVGDGSRWHSVGLLSAFVEGRPARRFLGETPLLVVRDGQRARVLADRCSHLSGPLSEGEVADGRVTCPWHGSVFALDDGEVVHGPATAPQPVFETRVVHGELQVRLPGAG